MTHELVLFLGLLALIKLENITDVQPTTCIMCYCVMQTAVTFEFAFRGRYSELLECLDIRSGLLPRLRDLELLTSQQIETINHVR